MARQPLAGRFSWRLLRHLFGITIGLPWRIELTCEEAATMKTGPDFNLTGYAPVAERIT